MQTLVSVTPTLWFFPLVQTVSETETFVLIVNNTLQHELHGRGALWVSRPKGGSEAGGRLSEKEAWGHKSSGMLRPQRVHGYTRPPRAEVSGGRYGGAEAHGQCLCGFQVNPLYNPSQTPGLKTDG